MISRSRVSLAKRALVVLTILPAHFADAEPQIRKLATQLDIGSGYNLELSIETPVPCEHPIVYLVVAPSRNDVALNYLSGTVASKIESQFDRILNNREVGDGVDSVEIEVSKIKVQGARPIKANIENFVMGMCGSFSGELLFNIGGGSVRQPDWQAAFVVKVDKGVIASRVRKGLRDYSPRIEHVNAEFEQERRLILTQGPKEPPTEKQVVVQTRLGMELNKEFAEFRIGRLQYGGPAHVAGLRSRDKVTAIDGAAGSLESAYSTVMQLPAGRRCPVSVVKAKAQTLMERFADGAIGIRANGAGDLATFRLYARPEHQTAAADIYLTEIRRIISESKDASEREKATIHELYQDGLLMKVFRLLYLGDEEQLKQELDYDVSRAVGYFAPIPGFSQAMRASENLIKQLGYVGLAAQYAIAKNGMLGLCGKLGEEFTVTTREYTVYRNLAGTYSNSVQTGGSARPLVVDKEFARALTLGSQAGEVHGEYNAALNRFLSLQGCDGRILKGLESNLLAHIGGRPLRQNPALDIVPREGARALTQRCERNVQDVNASAAADVRTRYCGCLADRKVAMSGGNLHSSYLDDFEGVIEKGGFSDAESGCLHYFE